MKRTAFVLAGLLVPGLAFAGSTEEKKESWEEDREAAAEALEDRGENTADYIEDEGEIRAEQMEATNEEAAEATEDRAEEVAADVEDRSEETAEQMEHTGEAVAEDTATTVTEPVEATAANVEETGEAATEEVETTAEATAANVEETGEAATEEVETTAEATAANVEETGEAAAEGVEDTAEATAANVEETGDEAATQAEDTLGDIEATTPELAMGAEAQEGQQLKGTVISVDLTGGTVEIRDENDNTRTFHGTPAQLSRYEVGQEADVSYRAFGEQEWISAEDAAQVDASGLASAQTVQGTVKSVDKNHGTVTLSEGDSPEEFTAHPSAIESLEPGQYVSVTFQKMGKTNWAEKIEQQDAAAQPEEPVTPTPEVEQGVESTPGLERPAGDDMDIQQEEGVFEDDATLETEPETEPETE